MKDVNFIRTLSPKEQKALRLWYKIMCGSFTLLCIGMLCAHIPQLYMWRMLKRQSVCCEMPRTQAINDQVKKLQEKESMLKQYSAHAATCDMCLASWIERLAQLDECGFIMQSCDIDAQRVHLVIKMNSFDGIKSNMQKLQSCSCIESVMLDSLQPSSDGYLGNITCVWKK